MPQNSHVRARRRAVLFAATVSLGSAWALPAANAQTPPLGPPPTTQRSPLPPAETPLPAPNHPYTVSPQPAIAGPITLNRAVSLALGLNPTIALADAQLLTSLGQTAESLSALRPTLSADVGAQGYSEGINAVRDNRSIGKTYLQPTVGATAALPIDITGTLRAASDAAHFQAIAARLDLNRTRNDVVAGVESAFYAALRERALVTVAQEDLRDSRARLDDANKKFQARTVGILDVARAQTDVAAAQQGVIAARSAAAVGEANLDDAIGLNVDTPLNLSDVGAVDEPPGVAPPTVPAPTPGAPVGAGSAPNAPAGELEHDLATASAFAAAAVPPTAESPAPPEGSDGNESPHLGADYDALIREAQTARPEILQADADIAAARKGIVYAHRSALPQLSVGLRYEYAASTFGTSVVLNNGQAFAGLTIPIFDSGLSHARIQEAQGREAAAQVQRRRAIDTVTLETRTAYLNLTDARDRVAVANQALAQAREAFILARIRYNAGVTEKAGVSPLLEVSDAQAALTLAETRQVNALYDYNNARVVLDRAVGRYAYLANAPGYSAAPSSIH